MAEQMIQNSWNIDPNNWVFDHNLLKISVHIYLFTMLQQINEINQEFLNEISD